MREPLISDWELYFDMADGYENRLEVMKAFVRFWENPHEKKLVLPGKCSLGGRFGKIHMDNFFSYNIKSIVRTPNSEKDHQLMRLTTATGTNCYVHPDEVNGYMSLMISDVLNKGALNPRRYFYLSHDFYGSEYI